MSTCAQIKIYFRHKQVQYFNAHVKVSFVAGVYDYHLNMQKDYWLAQFFLWCGWCIFPFHIRITKDGHK